MSISTKQKQQGRMSDEAVKAKTGRTWAEWFTRLDAAGMADKPHKEIALYLYEKEDAGDWWSQMVTVEYEIERGKRERFQNCNGVWQGAASKTLAIPVELLFDYWNEENLRKQWLDEHITIRKSTRPKSLRITWSDGTTDLDVNLYSKGENKSSVNLQHSKLKDADHVHVMKTYWSKKLAELENLLTYIKG